ncbi:MAG: isoleucine--tRNA ligase [Tepidisphaeraceae bacterium]|jgi:isoleucyl-tRNA synthetase
MTTEKKNYKETLNLPQTAFAMEAKLTANEPLRLAKWREMGLYDRIQEARQGSPKWILHDGPPFANGDIHMGHVINKTLKDVFIRFRTMQGFQTPYVPGWDCHGLPIEHKIQQDLGPKLREMTTPQVRQKCFEYAEKYVKVQSEQFQRLGILGQWSKPYQTMSPDYEAQTLEVLARFVEQGLVYKKLKPVPWSIENQTALADAELEYQDVSDKSVYVEFPLDDSQAVRLKFGLENLPIRLLVWTTTPWTLPANLAVAIHPDVEYVFSSFEKDGVRRIGLLAKDLTAQVFGSIEATPGSAIKGRDLIESGLQYRHPFIDRRGRLVAADYVTTTDGTGLVHTAPGHGEDDYETGIREGLEVYSPVLANGRFDQTAPDWLQGKKVWEANALITERLRTDGLLFREEDYVHSYPHDWRSKTKIIFRATEQWFINVDKPISSQTGGPNHTLRQRATQACAGEIKFVPDWGRQRIGGMLQSRPDWCISRQRAWGLPIPVFYNEKGEALLTPQSVRAVARRFAEKGSDAWFSDSPAELLGPDFTYPPNFSAAALRKEKDIFDVWFESGSSWQAVLRQRPELYFPADLYLEGSDQHRGWFQLSLLNCLGATGKPPFTSVLTHGFIVKPDGKKVSKSDKEYVTATQEIDRHGADLLRLWCCSVDYQGDIPTSPKVIQEFGDKYRKIRNTLRYLLSNLYDFNPAVDAVAVPQNSLDGWVLAELDQLIVDVTGAYDAYQLHRAFRLLYDFCAVQISAVYGNAMKDRLYCAATNSPERRRCQTVMRQMAVALCKLLAPMIVFTADEAWEHVSAKPAGEEASVHLGLLPKPSGQSISEAQQSEWKTLISLRDAALAQLDKLKKDAGMNKALDAEVIYHVADADLRQRLSAYGADLEDIVGAGFHSWAHAKDGSEPSVTVIDRRQDYPACARSWKRRPDVGSDKDFPDLSARDAAVVKGR